MKNNNKALKELATKIEKLIKEEKARKDFINKRINRYKKNCGEISRVEYMICASHEEYSCGLCKSILQSGIIFDGVKKYNFCPECGILLNWNDIHTQNNT